METCWLPKGVALLDYPNGNNGYSKRTPGGQGQKLECISLKDVPLEVRRQEAKKPLFLKRYE